MTAVINSLLSYLLLVLVIASLAGVAIFLGIFLNKLKDKKNEQQALAEPVDVEE